MNSQMHKNAVHTARRQLENQKNPKVTSWAQRVALISISIALSETLAYGTLHEGKYIMWCVFTLNF